MDPVVLKEGIYWVGAVDWDMQYFHGSVYSTHRGTCLLYTSPHHGASAAGRRAKNC